MPAALAALASAAAGLDLPAVALLIAVGVFTPGPNNIILFISGSRVGFRRTLPQILGIVLGFSLLFALQGAALEHVFRALPWASTALKALLSAFLLWLAWKVATADPTDPAADERALLVPIPFGFRRAVLFQFINPKAWANVGAVLSIHGSGDPERVAPEAVAMALLALPISLWSASSWALFGSALRRWLARPARARAFNGAMAAALLAMVAWGWLPSGLPPARAPARMLDFAASVAAAPARLEVAAIALLLLVGAITPGPNNIILLVSGSRVGFRRTAPQIAGVLVGYPLLVALQGALLAPAYAAAEWSHLALKVVFSAFLLWLAWRVASADPTDPGADEGSLLVPIPFGFRRSALFQFANPKAWAVIATLLTLHGSGDPALAAAEGVFIALLSVPVIFPGLVLWAALGTGMRSLLRDPARARAFNLAMGAALVAVVAWGWI